MPRTKLGEQISTKEFMSRWKQGIMNITQLQQSQNLFWNSWLIVIGIVAGIVVSIYNFKNLWWLMIVLLGALGNTIVMQIANYQKMIRLKEIENYQEVIE